MPKARRWRRTTQPQKRMGGAATLSGTLVQEALPTEERMNQAGGAKAGLFEFGGSGMHRVLRMLDTPLEQLRARAQITEARYQTLWRFRMHWFLGHQSGDLRAIDLNRVIAFNRDYGDTTSEQALEHRDRYSHACTALLPIELSVTTRVVLQECGLVAASAELGYKSPYRGRMAALELLTIAADKIMTALLAYDRKT